MPNNQNRVQIRIPDVKKYIIKNSIFKYAKGKNYQRGYLTACQSNHPVSAKKSRSQIPYNWQSEEIVQRL